MKNKINIIKYILKILTKKYITILFSFLLMAIYYYIKLAKCDFNLSSDDLTRVWLEMSLIFAFFSTVFVFINLIIILANRAFQKNNNQSEINVTNTKKTKVMIGIIVGLVSCFILLIIVLSPFLEYIIDIENLYYICIVFAITALFTDWLLNCEDQILYFDFYIICGLILTLLLSFHFRDAVYNFEKKELFISGFTTGATALQIIIANLVFDPRDYSKDKIFG